jgi:apolipoprotein N-acyltransferase
VLPQSRAALLLFALASGALLALALPPIGWWPVIFVSLPLAVTVMRRFPGTLGNAALTGFCFGLGYFIAAFHWIGLAFLVDAKTYLWMMPIAVGGLAAFMACYWALAFAAAHLLKRRGTPLIASLPFALAIAEVARGHFFTGFPWAAPGLIADGMGGVLQLASLIGMPGLTYWVLLWGMLPLCIWRRRPSASARNIVPVLLLALLPASWLWGNWRLSTLHFENVPGVKLLLVQPNVSQDDKWRGENAGPIFDQLMALSTQGEEALGATHIIWPESSVPFLLDESGIGLTRIADGLQPGQTLIAGAIRRERGGKDEERYFTSVLEIDDEGVVEERYDKWRLVPGGEFLPLAWLLEPLGFRKVVNVPESFSAGPGPRSFALGAAGRAGLLICYEAIFPELLVETERRPDWLINVTNDGWFGRSVGPYQHVAQVRMRAVEQNIPVARAANTGVSAVIDGAGRFVQRSALGVQGVISSPLPKKGVETVFARWGQLLYLALALFVSLALAASSRRDSEEP